MKLDTRSWSASCIHGAATFVAECNGDPYQSAITIKEPADWDYS